MQYFEAVQEGKRRAQKSQIKLFDIAGFSMLTLTTKKKDGAFVPVGTEEYASAIRSPDGHVAIIVDGDGFTKAQSRAVEKTEALEIFKKLLDSGMPEFSGEHVEIWNDRYPVIRLGQG